MKVPYQVIFLFFGLVFGVTAVILYHQVVKNVQESAVVVEQQEAPKETPKTVSHLGEILYINQCASCHGGRGAGLVDGPSLINERWVFDEERIAWLISRIESGGNGMPPFKGRLRNDDIVRIVRHIEMLNQMASYERKKEKQ